jgi:hypothetical protein
MPHQIAGQIDEQQQLGRLGDLQIDRPDAIQRVAPFTSRPMPGISTATSSSSASISTGTPARAQCAMRT